MTRLKPEDYQYAISAQSACNLSGIVRSFARVTEAIWEDAREIGEGTAYVNRHPICRLYAEQIAHLAGAGTTTNSESYSRAYEECRRVVEAAGLAIF
jgi:hypothetical protein